MLSDGHDVVAYADARGKHPFFPHSTGTATSVSCSSARSVVDVTSPAYDVSRTLTIVSAHPLSDEGWEPLARVAR
ncbi:MAG: hypothetical protein R3B99_06645 [Polyangiales bacterium]